MSGLLVDGQDLADEVVLRQGLAGPLHGRALGRDLEPAVLALVAQLRVEVVGDDEHVLAVELDSPTSGLRLAVHTGLPDRMRAALLRAGRPARDYMQS